MIVSSEEIDGETPWPLVGGVLVAREYTSCLCRGEIMEGRIAVTIVEVAAPPMLKNSLASSSWG